jgi:hypothetical protein
MYNPDILILTLIIGVLFIVFFIATYREMKSSSGEDYLLKNKYNYQLPLISKIIKNISSDNKLTKSEKRILNKTIIRTISDMESDGIYFPSLPKENKIDSKKEDINI